MAKKKHETHDSGIENVEYALSKTEQFIEDNQKVILIILAVVFVIVAAFLGYNKFYLQPIEKEAQSQMFVAEKYFQADSFKLALYGDGNYLGFIDIIEEYGVTKSANLAQYYAGISFLRNGEYDNAIEYLSDFSSDDKMIGAIAKGAIGDAYVELGELDKAASYYSKAVAHNKNEFTCPIYLLKEGEIYEDLGENDKALEIYKTIKKEYPLSAEGRNVDMYIARIQANN